MGRPGKRESMKDWGRYVHDSHLPGRGTDMRIGHREVEKANKVEGKNIISVEHRDNCQWNWNM